MDQNEKLVHYGVTYMMARDGYSGKIVGVAVMPRKLYMYTCTEQQLQNLAYGINYEWIMRGSFFYLSSFKRGCILAVGMAPFIIRSD